MGSMKDKTCLWVIGKEVFQLNTLPIGEKDLARKVAAYRRLILKAAGGARNRGRVPGPGPERAGSTPS